MFSGIHSLIFGKKHHHRNHNQSVDDSAAEQQSSSEDGNFVVIERRHSDEPDVKTELYPRIDPSSGYLPYGISPSLPDLRPQSDAPTKKDGATIDFLHGVPFKLASYVDIITNENADKFAKFLQKTQDILTEDKISDGYNYDFNLEERVLSEFQT